MKDADDDLPPELRGILEQIQGGSATLGRLSKNSGANVGATARMVRELEALGLIRRVGAGSPRRHRAPRRRWRS